MKFYSQFKEDEYLITVLPKAGRFLDIGSWVPTIFSNTRVLFEMGWSGIMIEPSPGPFLAAMQTCSDCGHVPGLTTSAILPELCHCGSGIRYGNHPRITMILGAIGTSSSSPSTLTKLYLTDDALSTFQSDIAKPSSPIYKARYYGTAWMPQIRLERLLMQFGSNFDFISIDTEGSSARILFHLLKLNVRPLSFCVESADMPEQRIITAANAFGYEVGFRSAANLVLVKKELLNATVAAAESGKEPDTLRESVLLQLCS